MAYGQNQTQWKSLAFQISPNHWPSTFARWDPAEKDSKGGTRFSTKKAQAYEQIVTKINKSHML